MPEPATWLDDDQVKPEWVCRQRRAVGQCPRRTEGEARPMKARPFAPVDGLLGQAEVAPRAPAHLDHDHCGRRPGIDGQQVELGPTDPQLPREHPPTDAGEVRCDSGLGPVAGSLSCRAHPLSVARCAYPRLNSVNDQAGPHRRAT